MSRPGDIAIMKKQPRLKFRPLDMSLTSKVRDLLQLRYQPRLVDIDNYYRDAVREKPILYISHLWVHQNETRQILTEYWNDVEELLEIQARWKKAVEDARPRANSPPSMMYLHYQNEVCEGQPLSEEFMFTMDMNDKIVSGTEHGSRTDRDLYKELKRNPSRRQREDDQRTYEILFGKKQESSCVCFA
ncbi:hypothetical protein NX059_001261 [Plenodomus lindquistii]|nr:hypothetical protein NX059_001261 [Plenodomus lindquistii]